MLNVWIVDDNDGMRLVMRKAVEKAGHNITGEAKSGEEALELLEKSDKPQVIFLDIEMGGMDGVETARRIQDTDPRIAIVFVTAHEEFRKEAFEVYAFDYLVKPFEVERVKTTLERVEDLLSGVVPLPIVAEPSPRVEKLMLRHKDGISLVDARDIILIQRENRSTVIYTKTDKHVTSETLSEIEQRLPGNKFFRCHKSYIINIERITRIYPYGRWTYIVKLSGTDLDALMTQERYAVLQTMFH